MDIGFRTILSAYYVLHYSRNIQSIESIRRSIIHERAPFNVTI